MRTLSASESAVVATGSLGGVALRVLVKDAGGTFRDLTTYPGRNMVLGATWRESMDDNGITAEVRLIRAQDAISLSPLHDTSPLNRDFTPSASPSALLAPARDVRIEWAVVPEGQAPVSGDWKRAFDGRIDTIDWASEVVTLECRDMGGLVQDTFLEYERVYAYAQGANQLGCRVWQPSTPYLLGERIIPTQAKLNAHYYRVTTAGTSGSTEPAWPTGGGATVSDGTAVHTESGAGSNTAGTNVEAVMQQILDDAFRATGLSAPALAVPSSPAWLIKWYLQKRQGALEAVRALADQIGWDVRYRWDSGSSTFKLTLWEPPRTKTTPDRTVAVSDVMKVSQLRQSLEAIRNVVRVTYSDSADLDSKGQPKRKQVIATSSASITAFGRRWMEIQEGSSSNIDTSTEATTMANAIVADLATPAVDLAVEVRFFPWTELGDLYRFTADGVRFTSNQDLAVVSYEHTLDSDGTKRTTYTVRGKPSGGWARWLRRDSVANPSDVHIDVPANNGGTFTLAARDVVGGTTLTVSESLGRHALPRNFELHVSESSGFTPGTSTLKLAAQQGGPLPDLVPGKTYYAKAVPYGFNSQRVVQGQPSAEISFVAGRARSGHYDSAATQSHLPLNGNFEHALDDLATAPPDHWAVVALGGESESWGSSGSVYHGTDTSKGRYLTLRAHASQRGRILSSPFEVRRGVRALNIYLSIRRQTGSGSGSPYDLIVDVFGFSDSALATQIINYSVFLSGSASGDYPTLNTWYDTVIDFGGGYGPIPTNVNFLQLAIRRSTTGSTAVAWDIGDVYVQEADFYRATLDQSAWTNVTYQNSFADYGASDFPASYFKDSMGVVHLRGLVARASAALNTTIFTLPAGYRPTKFCNFAVMANRKFANIEINSSGDVKLRAADDASWFNFFNLDGITFDTR